MVIKYLTTPFSPNGPSKHELTTTRVFSPLYKYVELTIERPKGILTLETSKINQPKIFPHTLNNRTVKEEMVTSPN